VKDVGWLNLVEGNGQWRMKKLTLYTTNNSIYFNRRGAVDSLPQNLLDIWLV
jgi:hypothetical protein